MRMENLEVAVKEAQLDLLDELVRICEKNNIKYVLVGGTLIGAIRHNGFIPWDDDIDVGMTRDDYEKFLECCKNDLSKEYEVYNWYKDKHFPHPFSKLKIKNSHYTEELSKNSEMNDSIFIDVFPFDNAPKNKFKQKKQKYKIIFYRKALLIKCNFSIISSSIIKRVLYFPIVLYSKLTKRERIIRKLEKEIKKYNHSVSEYVVNHGGSYSYETETAKREWFTNIVKHIFEKKYYFIPKDYDSFLTHVYGDYMKLPPKSQRSGKHKVLKIDLGAYKTKSKGRITNKNN